ncbi:19763_t:CDS:2, partial [Racocetra persica]
LKWLQTAELTGRRARWVLRMQPYNFKIQHRRGHVHRNVDALSRLPVKQKTYHDQRHQIISGFEIGDKVLLEDAAKKYSRSEKFSPKCKGPYYIHDKLPNDAYKLKTLDGKVIVAPFN